MVKENGYRNHGDDGDGVVDDYGDLGDGHGALDHDDAHGDEDVEDVDDDDAHDDQHDYTHGGIGSGAGSGAGSGGGGSGGISFGNYDGGEPDSVYGGITPLDAGGVT